MRSIILASVMVSLVASVSCTKNHLKTVVIETEVGSIYVEIDQDRAPVTAGNFLHLVESGAYTNSKFYRVVRLDNQPVNPVKIEVIQGGLLEDSLMNRFGSISHEPTSQTGIRHTDGVISMARNEPGTASTEFFICIGDQPSLDEGGQRNPDGAGFAAFGKVTRGMDVVRNIQSMQDSLQFLHEPVAIRRMHIKEPATF